MSGFWAVVRLISVTLVFTAACFATLALFGKGTDKQSASRFAAAYFLMVLALFLRNLADMSTP